MIWNDIFLDTSKNLPKINAARFLKTWERCYLSTGELYLTISRFFESLHFEVEIFVWNLLESNKNVMLNILIQESDIPP